MAIGLGMLFGFTLPENFNRPYSAVSITDFWRRWHITLSQWFRNDIFFPLRRGMLRFSLHLYNNEADVDRVLDLVREHRAG